MKKKLVLKILDAHSVEEECDIIGAIGDLCRKQSCCGFKDTDEDEEICAECAIVKECTEETQAREEIIESDKLEAEKVGGIG